MNKKQSILSKGQILKDKYTVTFFLKKGNYAETYRVKNQEGKTKLLKLFSYSKLDRTQFDNNGDILEIELLKKIKHPNLATYFDSGKLLLDNQKYAFVILDFISGETLADKMKREQTFNVYEAKDIITGVLNGLNYLHTLESPIIHNDITNLNIMTDLSGKVVVPKIIDFGYARYLNQTNKDYLKDGLNPFYQANEAFNKVFSVQSDVFSAGALYYHLLEGLPPWFVEISKYKADSIKLEDTIIEKRKKPLKFSSITDQQTQNIISKALQPNTENRFNSVKDFIKAINGEMEVQQLSSPQEVSKSKLKETEKGKGFDAIAGLDDLKKEMKRSVIDVLQNPEKAQRYGAKLPSGMVLYGPPGCGKTFFAKHFAEEVGFNYMFFTGSGLKSRYVNATQENIAQMFEEAEINAPSIIFIDEINELLPNRDSEVHEMAKSAVNEMLAQMDGTGEKGIFIIGATNYPNMIDPAMLRAGRLEKKFYLPPPDFKLRKALFEMSLNKRKKVIDFGLDYERLSNLTDNYVSSDIELIINEATSIAMVDDSRITMTLLEEVIKKTKPSVPLYELKKYEQIKAKMEGLVENTNERPRIGFRNN